DAFVQRAATDALGRHPAFENVTALLDLRNAVSEEALQGAPANSGAASPPARKPAAARRRGRQDVLPPTNGDTELLYKVRQALRDQLRVPEILARLPWPDWSEKDGRAIADVAVGVP